MQGFLAVLFSLIGGFVCVGGIMLNGAFIAEDIYEGVCPSWTVIVISVLPAVMLSFLFYSL